MMKSLILNLRSKKRNGKSHNKPQNADELYISAKTDRRGVSTPHCKVGGCGMLASTGDRCDFHHRFYKKAKI